MSKLHSNRGVSALEFALMTLVWVPLLLGTMSLGIALIRAMEALQVTRDAGHMYARGVDFAFPGNQDMLARLGAPLNLQVNGGSGAVVLSTLTYVGRQECKALGLADNSSPPNPTAACTNYQHFVFTHRIAIGNSALRISRTDSPTAGLANPDTGYIDRTIYVKNAGARADKFTLVPKPREDGTDGFQAGQFIYLAETTFNSPNFPGFTAGGRIYSYLLF